MAPTWRRPPLPGLRLYVTDRGSIRLKHCSDAPDARPSPLEAPLVRLRHRETSTSYDPAMSFTGEPDAFTASTAAIEAGTTLEDVLAQVVAINAALDARMDAITQHRGITGDFTERLREWLEKLLAKLDELSGHLPQLQSFTVTVGTRVTVAATWVPLEKDQTS
jgi:DNA-binding FrmR family transcriptional regulator